MRKTLVVVDMQVDFVTGALGTPEARSIVPAVVQKVKEYQDAGLPVVFTKDTHGEDYLSTQEGKLLPVPHCIRRTEGHNLIPELESLREAGKSAVVEKETFGSSPTAMTNALCLSGYMNADEYELCGVCTDICVISNAVILRTMFPESRITVDSTAVAGVTPEKNAAALEVLKSLQVNVI